MDMAKSRACVSTAFWASSSPLRVISSSLVDCSSSLAASSSWLRLCSASLADSASSAVVRNWCGFLGATRLA